MTDWLTGDEHYGHKNAIKYNNRPFDSVEEMDNTIVANNNELVKFTDTVFHLGDFTFGTVNKAQKYTERLNGKHVFLKGCHDYWLPESTPRIKIIKVQWMGLEHTITLCHYAMRTWYKSHYNSWHAHAHAHGRLEPAGKQWDVGVDNNDYYPLSIHQFGEIMDKRPDNFNLVKRRLEDD